MNKIKRIFVTFLALALALTFIPSVTAEAAKKTAAKAVVVKTQAQLVTALKSGAKNITLKTDSKITVKIPKGDFYNVKLTINAPKATISNKGDFLSIKVVDATAIKEFASGNDITISDKKLKVTVASTSLGANIKTTAKNANITMVVNGEPDSVVVAGEKTTLDIKSGTTLEPIPVTVTGSESNIKTALNADVVSEVATQVVSKTDDALVTVENKSDEKVEIVSASGEKKEIATGEAAVVDNGKVDSYIADSKNKTDANGNKINDGKTPTKKPSNATTGGTNGGSGDSGSGSSTPSYNGGLIKEIESEMNGYGVKSLTQTITIPAWKNADELTKQSWHHQVTSNYFTIQKDHKYEISFTITSTDDRPFKWQLHRNSGVAGDTEKLSDGSNNPLWYAWYAGNGDNVTISAGVETPIREVYKATATDNYARLCIDLVKAEESGNEKVTIKNVKVVDLGVDETPAAPGEESDSFTINAGLLGTSLAINKDAIIKTAKGAAGVVKKTENDNEIKIKITNPGTEADAVQLAVEGLSFESGATYKYSFKIKSDVAAGWNTEIAMINMTEPNQWKPWAAEYPSVNTSVTEVSKEFVAGNVANANTENIRFYINLGHKPVTEWNKTASNFISEGESVTITISDLKLEKIADAPAAPTYGPECVKNNKFTELTEDQANFKDWVVNGAGLTGDKEGIWVMAVNDAGEGSWRQYSNQIYGTQVTQTVALEEGKYRLYVKIQNQKDRNIEFGVQKKVGEEYIQYEGCVTKSFADEQTKTYETEIIVDSENSAAMLFMNMNSASDGGCVWIREVSLTKIIEE